MLSVSSLNILFDLFFCLSSFFFFLNHFEYVKCGFWFAPHLLSICSTGVILLEFGSFQMHFPTLFLAFVKYFFIVLCSEILSEEKVSSRMVPIATSGCKANKMRFGNQLFWKYFVGSLQIYSACICFLVMDFWNS